LKSIDDLDISAVRILDGGMATELEQRGCDISGPLWSAHVLRDSPATIEAVHASYLDAGADCILTASYQVSFPGFAALGFSREQTSKTLRDSVRLAQTARDAYRERNPRPVLIAASLGPYGAALHNGAEYHGNYVCDFESLVSFHAERLAVLQSTEADLVAFETVPSLVEAEAIVTALRRYPHIGAWISFSCKDETHTGHGEQLAQCGEKLDAERQIVAVGINCTSPKFILPLIAELSRSTMKPIFVYPNSGEEWDAQTQSWRGDSDPAAFASLAHKWYRAGAQAVGGCCRTGPQHVRAIGEAHEVARG
jgi:homocysteine S-methyltransferase